MSVRVCGEGRAADIYHQYSEREKAGREAVCGSVPQHGNTEHMGEAQTQEKGAATDEAAVVDARHGQTDGAFFIVVQEVPGHVPHQTPLTKTTTTDTTHGHIKDLLQRPRRGFSFFRFRRREPAEAKMKVVRGPAPLPGALADVESDGVHTILTPLTEIHTSVIPFTPTTPTPTSIVPLTPAKQLVGRLNQDPDLQDFSLLYNFLNTREKGHGDFTSVTFEEELGNDDGSTAIPTSNSHNQQHPRPPTGDGKALFVTSSRLPAQDVEVGLGEGELKLDDLECWMSRLPPSLQRLPLNHLYIPGSHDSFSYSLSTEGGIGPDAPSQVTSFARLCPCLTLPALLRWSVTQQATVTTQLKHGIRYFDIRVATRDNRFYFVHGLYGEDLQTLLSEIQHFLSKHPGEVVMLDFQHFHGLTPADHAALTTLLRETFTTTLCPTQYYQPTLTYLADRNYQVLVFYRDSEGREGVPWLWPSSALPNPWPDTTSVPDMLAFLEERLVRRDPTFFVTQCVLTPSSGYLSRHWWGRLERLARRTNKAVPAWLEELPSGPPGANVVMTDFVEQDDWAIPLAVIKKNYQEVK